MQNSKLLKIIIFTDLDGTLLDHETYSFEKAKPALEKARETETPVVFVTSKTFAEVEAIQKKMDLWGKEPFIVENGGALFIPEGLFEVRSEKLEGRKIVEEGDFWKVEFGRPYQEVRRVLKEAAKEAGLKVRGIGDMTAEEFSADCGLPLEDAKRAKQRMYQEGFKILVPPEQQKQAQERIKAAIEKRGFHMSIGGRYCQISGERAKVKAVEILTNLFRKKYGEIVTIGLGDAQADLEFIELCDQGYLIRNPNLPSGALAELGKAVSDKIHRTEEEGPEGWNKVVLNQLFQGEK
jgi:mannosyl-3-phosphoglycerate phosphatase